MDFEPWEPAGRPQETTDFQPRLGFAYTLNDRTVIRGGAGLYYADVLSTNLLWPVSPLSIAQIQVNNDERADFAVNPFNGPAPSYSQALQRFCDHRINRQGRRSGSAKHNVSRQRPCPNRASSSSRWSSN